MGGRSFQNDSLVLVQLVNNSNLVTIVRSVVCGQIWWWFLVGLKHQSASIRRWSNAASMLLFHLMMRRRGRAAGVGKARADRVGRRRCGAVRVSVQQILVVVWIAALQQSHLWMRRMHHLYSRNDKQENISKLRTTHSRLSSVRKRFPLFQQKFRASYRPGNPQIRPFGLTTIL